jgi:uncharacterized protein (DUF983 family)
MRGLGGFSAHEEDPLGGECVCNDCGSGNVRCNWEGYAYRCDGCGDNYIEYLDVEEGVETCEG